jgi:RNA polymerase sigma-70 factor (ECF subfamily)
MSSILDGELWARARAGDADALGGLFRRHAGAIHGYCFRRTGDWAQAEDLTSVTFLEAWRRRNVELEDEAVLPWLYGVATNVLRNSARSVRRYQAAIARIPAPPTPRDPSDDIMVRLSAEEEVRAMHLLLQQLPRHEQDVIALVHWQDLTIAEAAIAVGVSDSTVRSQLSRAHTRLRQLATEANHRERRGAIDEPA